MRETLMKQASLHSAALRVRLDPTTKDELADLALQERLLVSELVRRELRAAVVRLRAVTTEPKEAM